MHNGKINSTGPLNVGAPRWGASMGWTKLAIQNGSGARNGVALMQIQEQFWNWYAPKAVERSHGRGDLPQDVAMFSQHDPRTADVTVYFTPNAAEFAARVDGTESSSPPAMDKYLELNVGDQLAWELVSDPGEPAPGSVEA